MKVFVSWSGERSQILAKGLADWLRVVIQTVDPFVSMGIPAGKRWADAIGKNLEASKFGIFCLTRDNATAPWLNFEAGACSKFVADSHVVPYLIDGTPTDYEDPWAMFQIKETNRQGTEDLLRTLNDAVEANGGKKLTPDVLAAQLEAHWPRLEQIISKARYQQADLMPLVERTERQLLQEVLERVRSIEQALPVNQFKEDDENPGWTCKHCGARMLSGFYDELATCAHCNEPR